VRVSVAQLQNLKQDLEIIKTAKIIKKRKGNEETLLIRIKKDLIINVSLFMI